MRHALLFLLSMLSLPCVALATGENCEQRLEAPAPELPARERFLAQIQSAPANVQNAHGSYARMKEWNLDLEHILPEEAVYSIFLDDDTGYYRERLAQVISAVEANPSQDTLPQKFHQAFALHLREDHLSAHDVAQRLDFLHQSGERAVNLQRALGELTLAEIQQLVHGGDPLNPTPESLLGKYMAETGARSRRIRFSRGPGYAEAGVEKLAVAFNESTFPTYLKYFKRIHFLIHTHTPSQGTLNIAFNGDYGSYGSVGMMQGNTLRAPTSGNVAWPHILLKTSEALRLKRYFQMAILGHSAAHMPPWTYRDANNLPYCAIGGYTSCTYWFGDIPIGDELVSEYTFPGYVDQYASNHLPGVPVGSAQDAAPRTQPLRPYVLSVAPDVQKVIRKVWTVPGHAQLADVLGAREANVRGEFANPGWVAHTLLGSVGVDRVPFVFVRMQDVTQEIPENYDPGMRPL